MKILCLFRHKTVLRLLLGSRVVLADQNPDSKVKAEPGFNVRITLVTLYSIDSQRHIFQPFELGSETRLFRSAVINWSPGKFEKNF